MKKIFKAKIIFIIFIMSSFSYLFAESKKQTENISTDFVCPFLFNKDTAEPSITSDERAMFDKVNEIMSSEPAMAIEFIQNHITESSSSPVFYALGILYLQDQRYQEAQLLFEKAVNKSPGFMRAYSALARSLIEQGMIKEAIEKFNHILINGNPAPSTLTMIGYTLLLDNLAIPAETAYRQAVLLDNKDINAWLGLAKSLLLQERYSEARKILKEIITKNYDKPEIWYLLANTEIDSGMTDEAIITLETAKAINIFSLSSLITLGDLYLQKGYFEDAFNSYASSINIENFDHILYFNAVNKLIIRGQYLCAEKLLNIYNEKFSISENNINNEVKDNLNFLKAKIMLENGKLAESAQILKSLLKDNPVEDLYLLLYADILRRKKEFESALLYYQRAERVAADKVPAILNQVEVNVTLKRYNKAIELLERAQAIKDNPNVAEYLRQLRDFIAK